MFPFIGRGSLTKLLMPEYQQMVATAHRVGVIHPSWSGPEFFVRRSSRHHTSVSGVANSLANVVLEIRIQVGRLATLGDAHECMLHELSHAVVGNKVGHGPQFREAFGMLVDAHWPGLVWQRSSRDGVAGAYEDDSRVISALEVLYSKGSISLRTA